MARGPESKKTKQEKLLREVEKMLGRPIELPVELGKDLMREAASVLMYHEFHNSDSWTEVLCKNCQKLFVYSWDIKAVAYCSIPCMAEALSKRGIKWDPSKSPKERWGLTIPAIVPPEAVEAVRTLVASLEDRSSHEDEPPSP